MSFLLDTNIISAILRRPATFAHRMFQHSGRLSTSAINVAELRVWAENARDPRRAHENIDYILAGIVVLPFELSCASIFGQLRVQLRTHGIVIPTFDLLIAATALAHDLTVVTHNIADFGRIPDLRVVDWLSS